MVMFRILAAVAILCLAGITGVEAQTITPPPTPVSPPGSPTPARPTIGFWVVVGQHNFDAYAVPLDFHYSDEIHGYGFKAGERVTITPRNLSLAPVTVTADQYGAFSARFSFVWEFCGPHAVAAPAPVFEATGNAGSSATIAQPDPGCPALVVGVRAPRPPFLGPPASGASPGADATAIPVSTAVASRPPGVGVPGAMPHGNVTVSAAVSGFGFAPGESVTLTARNLAADMAPVTTNADDQGAFQVTLSLTLPCNAESSRPTITATGSQGTTLTRSVIGLGYCMDCPPNAMCPLPAPVPAPPGVDAGSSATSESTTPAVGVSIRHPVIRRGHMQQATVQTDGAQTVRMSVRYPGGSSSHLSGTSSRTGQLTLRWRVPSKAHRGLARVSVSVQPAGTSLSSLFTVR